MLVLRLSVDISGTRDGVEWPPRGGTVRLPDAEAESMAAAGLGVIVTPVVERAIVEPVTETADITSKPRTRKS